MADLIRRRSEYKLPVKKPYATYEAAGPVEPFAIQDGRLITGQQQHSSELFSELVIEALTKTNE